MAKYMLDLPWNYDKKDLNDMLEARQLTHLAKHGENCLKVNDGLRSQKGVIARVVERIPNHENSSVTYVIANNLLPLEDMDIHFGIKNNS